jgi:hypothetical protein
VFISADEADNTFVLRLVGWLRGHGYRVADGYGSQLDDSTAVLVVMTPSSQRSPEVVRQLERAAALRRPVFGLLLDGEPFVPDFVDVTDGTMPDPLIERLRALDPVRQERPVRSGPGWPWVLLIAALVVVTAYRLATPGPGAVGAVAQQLAVPVGFGVLLVGAMRMRRATFAVPAAVILVLGTIADQVGRYVPITFLDGLRPWLGYPVYGGLVGVAVMLALIAALAWYLLRHPVQVTRWSAPILVLLLVSAGLDLYYWRPYGIWALDTWPYLTLLAALAMAAIEPERQVRLVAGYAGLAVVVLRTIWLFTLTPNAYLPAEPAAGAATALALATLGLALSVRRPRRRRVAG